MDVLVERVAGLDVGKAIVTVCVRTPGPDGRRARRRGRSRTMSRSLEVMADWLVECGVTLGRDGVDRDVLEAGVLRLEDRMGTWLLNAAHMKAVPGRKSDVQGRGVDRPAARARAGRPSFVPPPEIRRLRNLTRYRVQLMGDRTRDAIRLEQLLEDASIKLSVGGLECDHASRRGRCWPSWSPATGTPRRWRTWRTRRCAARSRTWSRR